MAVIRGTNAGETLNGGGARDYIFGLLGNDRIQAGGGDDSVSGNAGADTLAGADGDDQLFGGQGKDLLDGGEGDDILDGGDDAVVDRLNGGAGDDAVLAFKGDVADGGAGDDTLLLGNSFDFDAAPLLYTIDLSGIGGSAPANTGFDGIKAQGFESAFVSLVNAKGGSSVIGSGGDDTIFGGSVEAGAKGHTLAGGAGDDEITGSDKADVINGGAGTDILSGGSGADKLVGGKGEDLFVASLDGVFPGAPAPAVDTITDFGPGDHFLIKGSLVDSPFLPSFDDADQSNPLVSGRNPTANSTGGQFLYNTATGLLSYDADGTGAEYDAVDLFKLTGRPALDASDFIFDL